MSAFNILVAEVRCPNCNGIYNARIQFKYGDTWQHEYTVGETILWGGNDIGSEDFAKVP